MLRAGMFLGCKWSNVCREKQFILLNQLRQVENNAQTLNYEACLVYIAALV